MVFVIGIWLGSPLESQAGHKWFKINLITQIRNSRKALGTQGSTLSTQEKIGCHEKNKKFEKHIWSHEKNKVTYQWSEVWMRQNVAIVSV